MLELRGLCFAFILYKHIISRKTSLEPIQHSPTFYHVWECFWIKTIVRTSLSFWSVYLSPSGMELCCDFSVNHLPFSMIKEHFLIFHLLMLTALVHIRICECWHYMRVSALISSKDHNHGVVQFSTLFIQLCAFSEAVSLQKQLERYFLSASLFLFLCESFWLKWSVFPLRWQTGNTWSDHELIGQNNLC